jgi:GntR family transcriptional repressor for pyruvate dehydrogenase complex
MLEKIKPISKETLADSIADQLIELILTNELKPGERLPSEKQLMEHFNVGRSSLREAIRALSVLGLVEVRVPEGMFVSKSPSSFLTKQLEFMDRMQPSNRTELIEVRKIIEIDIVEMAAQKATDEDIAVLSKIIESMRQEKDADKVSYYDQKFHLMLGEMCRNTFLLQIMLLMKNSMLKWMSTLWSQDADYCEQHEAIYRCIADRDVEGAVNAMRYHMDCVCELFASLDDSNLRKLK